MDNLSDKTIEVIKKDRINPEPRWKFVAKNYAVWLLFAVATLMVSVAVSIMIFMLLVNDWDVYRYLDQNLLSHIFLYTPYVWVIFLAVFAFIAYQSLRQTKRGYRFEFLRAIAAGVVFNVIFGAVLIYYGEASGIHNFLMKQMPYYDQLLNSHEDTWSRPGNGLLGGKVTRIINKNDFVLMAPDGSLWRIVLATATKPAGISVKNGDEIEIIGQEQDSSTVFLAKFVRSYDYWMKEIPTPSSY